MASARRQRPSTLSVKQRRSLRSDPEVAALEAAYDEVDFDSLAPLSFELDPALAERIRSRPRVALRQLTLRVATEQIDEARRVSAETGRPYQAVMRQWLAEGASRQRQIRATSKVKAPPRRRHG